MKVTTKLIQTNAPQGKRQRWIHVNKRVSWRELIKKSRSSTGRYKKYGERKKKELGEKTIKHWYSDRFMSKELDNEQRERNTNHEND